MNFYLYILLRGRSDNSDLDKSGVVAWHRGTDVLVPHKAATRSQSSFMQRGSILPFVRALEKRQKILKWRTGASHSTSRRYKYKISASFFMCSRHKNLPKSIK